jgi:hypothetical protein
MGKSHRRHDDVRSSSMPNHRSERADLHLTEHPNLQIAIVASAFVTAAEQERL